MVNIPPPEPNDPRPGPPGPNPYNVSFDEFIALIVAFLTVGAILLWGFTRGGMRSIPAAVFDFVEPATEGDRPLMDESFTEPEAAEEPQESEYLRRSGDLRGDDPGELDAGEPRALSEREPELMTGLGLGAAGLDVAAPDVDAPAAAPAAITDPEEAEPNPESTTEPLSIADVSPDYWAYPFIKEMYERDLLPDFQDSEFDPEKALNRADLAALINQAFLNSEGSSQTTNFSDVSPDYWASDAIAQVVDANFMTGYPEGDFRPDLPVPRYQVLVTLASGLGLRPISDPQSVLQQFEDRTALPDWAREQVAAAAENGLVVNHPNRAQMQPQETATRAEIVAMIYQALEETGQVPTISSQYVISNSP